MGAAVITTLLPTDDLLVVTREFINPAVSRAGLGRCLRRHGVSDLRALVAVQEGETPAAKKTFKDYEPGLLYTATASASVVAR